MFRDTVARFVQSFDPLEAERRTVKESDDGESSTRNLVTLQRSFPVFCSKIRAVSWYILLNWRLIKHSWAKYRTEPYSGHFKLSNKIKTYFCQKNDLHYRAHTCKYIGISQTASQNRTKDTKIIQKNIHIKSEIAVWRKLFICSWWVLIPLQNTYRLEDESLSRGILGNYVFFGACSEKLCLFELKNT